ncbi:MAG: hypothetical protein IT457_11155 [Planctomycetes bacterium]|nr:hypothetical protein [Planctomycetota bacterium]
MIARGALALAGALATALVATAAPLWTYAVSLALFGFVHVAVELRYVDERFGARTGSRLATRLAVPLLGIALVRVAAIAGLGDSSSRAVAEWSLGALLVLLVLPLLRGRGVLPSVLGAVALGLVAWAVLAAPLDALILFALLHNLTPIGFLAERLAGATRRRALALCAVGFVLVPLAILSGGAAHALESLGVPMTDLGPATAGELDLHLAVFVPRAWRAEDLAIDLFRAGAYLQCLHYAVVIHVLPRLGGGSEAATSQLRWPAPRQFGYAVALAAAALFAGFAAAFAPARSVYAVFAAIHAWLEVPALLIALACAPRSRPRPTEAAA